MSSIVSPAGRAWLPSLHEQDIIHRFTDTSIDAYALEASPSNEQYLAQKVAMVAKHLIAISNAECGVYRAQEAISKNTGSCIAYSEITSYVLSIARLSIATAWATTDNKEGHAFTLWSGGHHLWQVDGYSNFALPWQTDHRQRDQLHALAQEAIESQTPSIIETRDDNGNDIAQSHAFDGDYAQFYDRSTKVVILPPESAIQYFTQRAQQRPVNHSLW